MPEQLADNSLTDSLASRVGILREFTRHGAVHKRLDSHGLTTSKPGRRRHRCPWRIPAISRRGSAFDSVPRTFVSPIPCRNADSCYLPSRMDPPIRDVWTHMKLHVLLNQDVSFGANTCRALEFPGMFLSLENFWAIPSSNRKLVISSTRRSSGRKYEYLLRGNV